jgi:transposase
VSDGYGVYRTWLHGRQTCLAHLIRRARALSERHDPEIAWFGHGALAELQRLVHWATAPPTSGDVQTWYARMVHLMGQYRHRHDEAGTFARTLDCEMGFLWTFVVEEGVEPTNNRAEVRSVDQKPSVLLGGLVPRGAGGKACHLENSCWVSV